MNDYYVYIWKNPETNTIFYVGKGKNKRAWNPHANYRSGHKLKSLLKRGHNINSIVSIFKNNLTESAALQIEDKLIKKFKRIEDGGTLLNYALNGARISSKKKKQIDPNILHNITNLYENYKLSAAEISKKYNVCGTTILRWLRSNNVTIRPNSYPKKITTKNENIIFKMYKEGMSSVQIAKHYNVSPSSVTKSLKKFNTSLRGRRKRFKFSDTQKIIKMYKSGISSTVIANMYSVRCCTILRQLRESNIAIRTNSEAQKCFNKNN